MEGLHNSAKPPSSSPRGKDNFRAGALRGSTMCNTSPPLTRRAAGGATFGAIRHAALDRNDDGQSRWAPKQLWPIAARRQALGRTQSSKQAEPRQTGVGTADEWTGRKVFTKHARARGTGTRA